jgi:hypothetical protein
MAELKRVDIGFEGGQVIAVRITEEEYGKLRKALSEEGEGWHELRTQDSEVVIDLDEVIYVRVDTEQHKVGF